MRLTTCGKPAAINAPIVGRITTQARIDPDKPILLTHTLPEDVSGYGAILTPVVITNPPAITDGEPTPLVHSLREYDHLHDGDVVVIQPQGFVRTLYRPQSAHNALFLTERC